MTPGILGLHHVTAICSDPQRNLDFYAGVLGLRLVKRTVNFDDPRTHHFYFGDAAGRPGSVITFFAWPEGRGGRQGTGQAAAVGLSVVPNAMGYWLERLGARGVRYERPARRFDETVVAFRDPHGLMLELVAHEGASARDAGGAGAWSGAGVPAEHAIRGLHGVTLWADAGGDATAGVLADTLGLRPSARHAETLTRYAAGEAGDGGPGSYADLRDVTGFWPGTEGTGVVHHVAWRVADDAALAAMRERLVARGLAPTAIIDRLYFRSVYVREPGGVLFELATDGPGFAVDEPADQLGEHFVLPPWLQPMRAELEAALPRIRPPHENQPVSEGTSVFRES